MLPLLVLFLFGIIEFSVALLDVQSAGSAAGAAARSAAVQGSNAMADQQILLRLSQEGAGIVQGEITRVVIWHASGPTDVVPSACLTGSGNKDMGTDAVGACNVYSDPEASGGAFSKAASSTPTNYFGCPTYTTPGTQLDCNWPASDRQVTESIPGSGGTAVTDYVGIYIEVHHAYYTGLFGSGAVYKTTRITKLEPQDFSHS